MARTPRLWIFLLHDCLPHGRQWSRQIDTPRCHYLGLWGETRAKSLDDVVRLGQDEAEVEFIFDLENERYRVLRKRSLKTRQSALELQGFDQATQRYRPLSGAKHPRD